MNRRPVPLLLSSLMLLASCGASPTSESSQSIPSSEPSSSSASQESSSPSSVSSSSSSSSEEDTTPKEKADRNGYPYIQNLNRLKKHEFKGRWIWEAKDIEDVHVAFRRHINLSAKPQRAVLHLSCESKATVYVNGEIVAVDAVLKRGPTPFDSFYQDIDCAPYLQQGENVVCILVHYWGKSGNASVNSQQGGLIYDLDVDGTFYSSGSDTKVKRLQEYRNQRVLSATGEYPDRRRSTFLAEREIYFDARKQEDYAAKDYDDSQWADARVVASPGYLPFGDLYLGDIPAFTLEDLADMEDVDNVIGVKMDEARTVSFRLPENLAFLPYFELESEEDGAHIAFYTNTYETQNIVSLMDDFVAKQGNNVYQQLYWRTGYVFYLDLPAGVTLKRVGYRTTMYDAPMEGAFQSSDVDFDTLWRKAYNTTHICMRDTFMDCPERERSPYSGDSANQIGVDLYSMGENGWKMIQKTYQSLSGWAKEDGVFPLRWPSTTTNECPMQNLAFIQTVPEYLNVTGDVETVQEVYPILSNYVKLWNLNADGSVEYRPGTFMWTDWGKGMDEDLMENGWYYWALRTLKDLGTTLGVNDDTAYFENRMASIKGAFNAKFKKEAGFASDNTAYDDRGNALAILSGLADEDDYDLAKGVLNTIKQASPYMERFVLQAYGEMGALEEGNARMIERYRGMIDYEASTLWELWSSEPKDGTINHGWAGGPLIYMSKYVAGIQPTSAGYGTYTLAPSATLATLSAQAMTPKGPLSYTLTQGDEVSLEIHALDGGTLVLDDAFGEVKSISGSIVDNGDGTYALTSGIAHIAFE